MAEISTLAPQQEPWPAPMEGSIPAVAAVVRFWLQRLRFSILLVAAALAIFVLVEHPQRMPVFIAVALPTGLILGQALPTYRSTLPIFPAFVLLQALSLTLPLLAPQIAVDWRVDASAGLLASTIQPIVFWFAALWLGWTITPVTALSRSVLVRPLSDALRQPGYLPHGALVVMILIQFVLANPLYWRVFGPFANGLVSPLRALAALAGLAGGFVGAYCWSRGRLRDSLVWLVLFLIPVFQALQSLLLSSLQGILLAVLLGMWLGQGRRVVAITLSILLFLSFINSGKVAMRQKYWSGLQGVPSNPVLLLQEWGQAAFAARTDPDTESQELLTHRFNNLQNLLYVNQAINAGTPVLGGLTYTILPEVLVPRVLKPDKVRGQEGQVLLNLHFGRQRNRADTETAYIAWGKLAESVGNFGRFNGPLLVGLATGSFLRLSENIGRGQLLLSGPGLLTLSLAILWITAYEMVYSTFVAAAFQLIVAVSFLGWWFAPRSHSSSSQ